VALMDIPLWITDEQADHIAALPTGQLTILSFPQSPIQISARRPFDWVFEMEFGIGAEPLPDGYAILLGYPDGQPWEVYWVCRYEDHAATLQDTCDSLQEALRGASCLVLPDLL
jgi:hypothetical protein